MELSVYCNYELFRRFHRRFYLRPLNRADLTTSIAYYYHTQYIVLNIEHTHNDNCEAADNWEAFDALFVEALNNTLKSPELHEAIITEMKLLASIPMQNFVALYFAVGRENSYRPVDMIPRISIAEADKLFQQLVNEKIIAEAVGALTPKVYTPGAASPLRQSVLCLPVASNTTVLGMIVVRFSAVATRLSPMRENMLRLAAASLATRIENINLQNSLSAFEQLSEQRMAARTIDLQKVKTEYESIFDCVHSGITLIEPNTRAIEYANPAAVKLLGGNSGVLRGKKADIFFDDVEQDISAMRYLTLLYYDNESIAHTENNGIIPIMKSAATVVFAKRALLLITFFDISKIKETEKRLEQVNDELEVRVNLRTEELQEVIGNLAMEMNARKRFEAALERQEQIFATVFNIINIGICFVDANGVFIRVNPACCAIYGYSENELVGQRIDIAARPEFRDTMLQRYNDFIANEKELTRDIQILNKHGIMLDARMSSAVLTQINGEKISVHAIVDISESRQAQRKTLAALEKEHQLNELISNFVTMMSHEFRTPLTTILSYSQLLRRYRYKWPEEQQEQYFKNIEAGVKRLTELLEDVLQFGEVDRGSQILIFEHIDLREFCLRIADETEIAFSGEAKRVVSTISCNSKTAAIVPKFTRAIISNILSNALKYSPSDSLVYFSVECNHDFIVITITDNGIGMPKEYLPDIFAPFSRAENSGAVSGTGLGMLIVKNAVDLLGGSINISSDIEKGTTVTVSLPMQSSSAEL